MARASVGKTIVGPRGQSRKENLGPEPKRKHGASAEKKIGGQTLTPRVGTHSNSKQASAEKIIGANAKNIIGANVEKNSWASAEKKSWASAEKKTGPK